MLVLGIDPGIAITGYGLVASDGQALKPVAFGVLRTPAHTPTADRLIMLYDQLQELIREFNPDVAAVEQLFFWSNVTTAMNVSEARGVIKLVLAQRSLPNSEYTPMQVKQAVTGYGKADKAQVQSMVKMLLCLEETPRPDDAADALAVAICHISFDRFGIARSSS